MASAVEAERARRAASLKKLADEAARFPGSQVAAHWKNFQDATAEVERIRADCRAKGKIYRDPWCTNETALGDRITHDDHEW